MDGLWDRIEVRADGPVVRSRGLPAAEVLARLEAGEEPDRLGAALGLEAVDLIAALAVTALGTGEDDGPALIRARPRRPALAPALTEEALRRLYPHAGRPQLLALTAGLNQVHDFWDASHEAAQGADDLGERQASAYWHGIAHRREPDAGNASYWFRRVGRHPVFARLAEEARAILDAHGEPASAARLLHAGTWDPLAFIELCDRARPSSPTARLAGRLQRREMIALLDRTVSLL
jgi:uncharacterized protein (DUF433 family)